MYLQKATSKILDVLLGTSDEPVRIVFFSKYNPKRDKPSVHLLSQIQIHQTNPLHKLSQNARTETQEE